MSILLFPCVSEETCPVLQKVTSVRKDLRRLERLPFEAILNNPAFQKPKQKVSPYCLLLTSLEPTLRSFNHMDAVITCSCLAILFDVLSIGALEKSG